MNTSPKKKKHRLTWRSWHKWAGIVFSLFIIIFCFSGIIMNHRQLFSSCEVSRWWLPSAYHIDNWNQGVIKGTMKTDDKLIAYGQAGIWETDTEFKNWKDFNDGIKEGIDNRKISNVIRTTDGTLWCAGLYDAYRRDRESARWQTLRLADNEERISDITLRGDTVVILTRSTIYEATAPAYSFVERPIHKPAGYENKVTLYKTVWNLHSGELFGICGKLIVDAMGIVLIVLSITGIIFFILSRTLKHKDAIRIDTKCQAGWMKWNLRWHKRLGAWTIILTILLSATGMCLRPPLMIPLAITNVSPLPGSTLSNENIFHDKLRAIRWDNSLQTWILSTSDGFFTIGDDLRNSVPARISSAPTVSPMGVNVFCRNPKAADEWVIGSFSGLFSWNPTTGEITDCFSGLPTTQGHGRPVSDHNVTGWTADLSSTNGLPVVFDYAVAPSRNLPPMPDILRSQPLSLWNFALELHVGRCYEPFLGSIVSVLFVFIAGLILTIILVSGYIIDRRTRRKKV